MKWCEFYKELWIKSNAFDPNEFNSAHGKRMEVIFAPYYVFDTDGSMFAEKALKQPTYTVCMSRDVQIAHICDHMFTVEVFPDSIPGVLAGKYVLVFDKLGLCDQFPPEMFVDAEVPEQLCV